jgi:hypothetical protein
MNEKTDAKRTDILWKIALGMAAAGFAVTWAQPAGPLVAVPFGILAMWLRLKAEKATEPETAPYRASHRS